MRSSPMLCPSVLRCTGFALFAAACLSAGAQDLRTWTDLKGRTIEGTFVKQDDASVWIRRGDGKEIAIPKKSLSEEDLKHASEAAPAPAAGPAAGGRFATAKIDPTAWKPRAGGFKLGQLIYPANLETAHFIIAGSEKTRPAILAAYADAAERLWSDIAADYPGLAATFEGKKMPIILAEGENEAKTLAAWHEKHAEESSKVSYAYNLARSSIGSFTLDETFADEAGLTTAARLFRMDSKTAEHTRKTWPQRIHFLSSDIIAEMIARPKDNEDYHLSLVRLVFAYQREELICGKIESEVTFGGGAGVEGFKNGRNWAGATKKLLKAGAKPDIDAFLKTIGAKAEPRDLGFGLGLMHYIQADPARLAGFGKMLIATASDKKCPDPEAFAKGLGLDSPAALDAAWLAYMQSDAFQ